MQPWSQLSEALLKPLPADWRYNIQQAFSSLGEAFGKMMGDGQQKQRVGAVFACRGGHSAQRRGASHPQPVSSHVCLLICVAYRVLTCWLVVFIDCCYHLTCSYLQLGGRRF